MIRGTLHAHKNVGERMGRMLVTQTPGGLYEHFFEQVGEEASDRTKPPEGPPGIGRIVSIAVNYGIEILPPPSP